MKEPNHEEEPKKKKRDKKKRSNWKNPALEEKKERKDKSGEGEKKYQYGGEKK